MPTIHPTAIVDPAAVIADSVRIGPYCVVGPNVVLDDDVELVSQVTVGGNTHLTRGCQVFPFAVVGLEPQIYGQHLPQGRLEIGEGTVIREHATLNCGSPKEDGVTRIGSQCMLMIGTHVAHDCALGDGVIMANNATLGGHVKIGNHVFIGGLTAVHQRIRIGDHAFVAGATGLPCDVIPYGFARGVPGFLAGLNVVGMRRRGFDNGTIHLLRRVYLELFFGPGEWASRVSALSEDHADNPVIMALMDFVRTDSSRKILKPADRTTDGAA